MHRFALLLGSLAVAGALLACSRGGVEVTPSTATPASNASTPSPSASASPGAGSTAAGTPASGAARLVALNGTRCVGQWRNTTQHTSGAFATRLEAGGSGGAIHFEIGGPVFGGTGGTFSAPFRLVGEVMEIEAHSDWLGHLSARIGLDGKATGSLQEIPALGLKSQATVSDYSFADNRLAFNLQVEPNDGHPAQSTVVEAACSRS